MATDGFYHSVLSRRVHASGSWRSDHEVLQPSRLHDMRTFLPKKNGPWRNDWMTLYALLPARGRIAIHKCCGRGRGGSLVVSGVRGVPPTSHRWTATTTLGHTASLRQIGPPKFTTMGVFGGLFCALVLPPSALTVGSDGASVSSYISQRQDCSATPTHRFQLRTLPKPLHHLELCQLRWTLLLPGQNPV